MRDFTAAHGGITFYGRTQAMADAQVVKYRVQSAINKAERVDELSYANTRAWKNEGRLGEFLASLAPSEMSIVLYNTVMALGEKYSALDVYTKYQRIISAHNAQLELFELVKAESEYGCPEATAQMNSYTALQRFI